MDKLNRKHKAFNALSRCVYPTLAIENFIKVLMTWVDLMFSGGIVYANSGVGKTLSIHYIIQTFNNYYNSKIPIYTYSVSSSQTSEANFYKEILNYLNFNNNRRNHRGSVANNRARIADFLSARAQEVGESRVMLFIDEAENLSHNQLSWLISIQNQIKHNHVKLMTILVGTNELKDKKESLKKLGQRQITRRFMTMEYRFPGLSVPSDINSLLSAIDNTKIKINNKEQSLVSYFIPAATKGSFKIREYSKEVYELLIGSINHDSYNHGNQRLIKELPMEQVMGYIIHLLDVASENDNTNLTLSKELLSDCLVPPISHAINEFVFSINT